MAKAQALRLIPPLETYPRLVAFVQRPTGKLALLAAFGLVFALCAPQWKLVIPALGLLLFLPGRKEAIVIGASVAILGLYPWPELDALHSLGWPEHRVAQAALQFGLVGACLGAFALYSAALTRFPALARRPVRNMLLLHMAAMVAASYAPLPEGLRLALWALLIALGKYLWYFSYSIIDRPPKESPGLAARFGFFNPFWGGSNTPFPKGAAYLRKIECKTDEELAVCRLKALKLVCWALALKALRRVLRALCYGCVSVPGLSFSLCLPDQAALLSQTPDQCFPLWVNWMGLLAHFMDAALGLTVWGHCIIAACRMAGYKALRNTCRPLRSASIAEFWNRYYYYFKELLVDLFFYPCFLRSFKKSPKARMFFATLAAAGLGNTLFHFLRDIDVIMKMGFIQAALAFHTYAFYGLVLGSAIGLSQLFEKKGEKRSWFRQRVIQPALVIGFYCLVSIFDDPDRSHHLGVHVSFLLRLFNLQTLLGI